MSQRNERQERIENVLQQIRDGIEPQEASPTNVVHHYYNGERCTVINAHQVVVNQGIEEGNGDA